jgi:hypothetical protein
LAINGKISFEKRDNIVKDFYDDRHPGRVLIFSSVGSAGLNLSIADVVIFFVSVSFLDLTFVISFHRINRGQRKTSVRSEDELIVNRKKRPSGSSTS